MNILVVAEEAAGTRAVRAVAGSGHDLVAVLSGGGSGARQSGGVRTLAEELGVPTYDSALVRDAGFPDFMRRMGVDVLLNVHSLFLIPGEALQAATFGSFNLHPGPLPEYAGINTVSWALWEGADAYGVTLHWMVPSVDAGDIAYERRFPIPSGATALTLMGRCVEEGVGALALLLRQLSLDPGGVPRTAQDLELRRYFARDRRADTTIDWSLPARRVVGRVRACDYGPFPSPWGSAKARLGSLDVVVRRIRETSRPCSVAPGTLGEACGRGVLVAAGGEWVCVETVEHEGRRVPAVDLLRRQPSRPAPAAGHSNVELARITGIWHAPVDRKPALAAYLAWRLLKPGARLALRLVGRDPLPFRVLARMWLSCWRGLGAYALP